MNQEHVKAQLREGSCFTTVLLPIHRIDDQSLAGYELLSRGPEGEYKTPDRFFALCDDELKQIVDLHCLRQALKKTKDLAPDIRIHINLFPQTILSAIDELVSLLKSYDQRQKLCLELIEHSNLPDKDPWINALRQLRSTGVELAIDDIGYGASSLESLVVSNPEIIKIDKSYVHDAYASAEKRLFLQRLVSIGKALNCGIVAEGVDSPSDREFAHSLNIEFGQGLLFGALP